LLILIDRQYYLKGERLLQKGIRHQQFLFSKRRTKVLQAVAVPIVPSLADSAEYRNQLAERYGFKQIGEPLPENFKLKDVIDTLPKKVMLP
jgi:acyl-lipid omega-6 desaturase (Delta-12 desaturase)